MKMKDIIIKQLVMSKCDVYTSSIMLCVVAKYVRMRYFVTLKGLGPPACRNPPLN